MADFQLTREFGVVEPIRDRRIQDDVQYIFANSSKYPAFRDSIGALLSELFVKPNNEPIIIESPQDLVMGLRVLTDWIAEAPANDQIRVVRSRLWRTLGRTADAIKDVQVALDINPENTAAKKLLEELQSQPAK